MITQHGTSALWSLFRGLSTKIPTYVSSRIWDFRNWEKLIAFDDKKANRKNPRMQEIRKLKTKRRRRLSHFVQKGAFSFSTFFLLNHWILFHYLLYLSLVKTPRIFFILFFLLTKLYHRCLYFFIFLLKSFLFFPRIFNSYGLSSIFSFSKK